jgi:hypothetical protein
MANQMIALGVRGPQIPDVSRANQQFAQMANMMMQQRAAERQSAQAQQAMQFAAAEEGRRQDTHGGAMKQAQLQFVAGTLKQFQEDVANLPEGDLAAAEALRADFVSKLPGYDKFIAPATQWTPDYKYKLMMDAEKEIDKTIATPVASLELSKDGMPRSVTVGGMNPEQRPVYDAPEPGAMPTATPATAPQMSQATPETLNEVVTIALETGVMSKTNYDKLLSIAPPESRAKIAGWVQSNNIEVVPETGGDMRMEPMSYDGQTPQSEFAVYRGQPMQSQVADLRSAPPMQQTLAQTQTQRRTSTPLQMRNPNVSPLPGSAQVPLSRVRGEAEARRETPEQAAARKTAELQAAEAFEETNRATRLAREREKVFATERAKKDAEFLEGYNNAREMGRNTLNVIRQMIGDLKVENGNLVMPKGGQAQHGGFSSVVGAGIPGLRFIPGTQSADFDAMLEQVQGGAFLEAYEKLKGTGQITEIEGKKATDAITRMRRSSSEVGFVRAAREFEDIITRAIARADKRYSALTGASTAAPAQRVTPTKSASGWGKAKVVGN